MHVDDALQFIDDTLVKQGGKRLNDIQRAVFKGSWEDRGYKEIPRLFRLTCTDDYLAKDVGPELWQLVGKALGERVTKKNLRGPVELAYRKARTETTVISHAPLPVRLDGDTLTTERRSSANGLPVVDRLPPGECSPDTNDDVFASLDRSHLPSTQQDWGSAPDVSLFKGRERELGELTQWLTFENCRLLAIVGIAGVGKTYLAVKLAQEVRDQFECLIWRSLTHYPSPPTLDVLLADLIPLVSEQQETEGALSRLIHYLRHRSCLIVLDGFEVVLGSRVHDGSYLPGYEAYGEFLRQIGETSHQSRVVITSWEKPRQIANGEGETQPVRSYKLNGLGEQGSLGIFAGRGVGVFAGSDREWYTLFRRYAGHPLALNEVAGMIWEVFGGNIGEFLAQMQHDTMIFDELEASLQKQFDRLSDLEQTIVGSLAIHHEPAEVEAILQLVNQPLSRMQLVEGLQSLRRRSLIHVDASRYSLHPLMLEFVSQRLPGTP